MLGSMSTNDAGGPEMALNLDHDHMQGGKIHLLQTMCSVAVFIELVTLQEGKAKLLQSLHCEALMLGSMSAEAACSLGREVQAALASALPLDQRPCQQAAIIPPGSRLHRWTFGTTKTNPP